MLAIDMVCEITQQDIFQFFIRQLKYFTGPSCPNYSEYFYLIESLSNVKSATLMATLPGADQLMTEMAKQFFDLAR
jgi:sister-chromatid-cohesion protein PDS5